MDPAEYVKEALLEKLKNDKEYPEAKKRWLAGESLTSICNTITMCRGRLASYLKAEGYTIVQNGAIYTYHENAFEIIDTPEKAYWLGFLYADGYTTVTPACCCNLRLKGSDKEILDKFAKFVGDDVPVKISNKTFNGKPYKIAEVSIANKKMTYDIIEKGCVPKKGLIVEFPSTDIVPKELQLDFIRGVWDGDGTISTMTNTRTGHSATSVSLVSASKKMILGIRDCLRNHGLDLGDIKVSNSRAMQKMNRHPLYTIRKAAQKTVYHFYELLYEGKKDLSLKRKYDKIYQYAVAFQSRTEKCDDKRGIKREG